MSNLHKSHLILTTVLWSTLVSAQITDIGTRIQDITTYPAYSQQKSCAQSCFVYGGGTCWEDVLGVQIGCAQSRCQPKSGMARNDCYCSAGLIQPAYEILAACVSSKCSVNDVSVDVQTATSIYSRYCAEKSYTAGPPAAIPAKSTGTATTRATSPRSASTPENTSPSDNNNNGGSTSSSSTGSGGLSIGTIIGIVVGSCAAFAFLAIAIWFFWKIHSGRKQRSQFQQPQYPQQQPVYPKMPDQQQPWYPSPGPASEVGPSDSVSMVGGMARPAPTLVSDMRSQGRWH